MNDWAYLYFIIIYIGPIIFLIAQGEFLNYPHSHSGIKPVNFLPLDFMTWAAAYFSTIDIQLELDCTIGSAIAKLSGDFMLVLHLNRIEGHNQRHQNQTHIFFGEVLFSHAKVLYNDLLLYLLFLY